MSDDTLTLGELAALDGSTADEIAQAAAAVADRPFAWLLLQVWMSARNESPGVSLADVAELSMSDLAGTLIEAGVFAEVSADGDSA